MEHYAFARRLTPCAEFPNDNQDLHHGATWVGVELGRAPVCQLPRPRLFAAAFEEEPREPDVSAAPSTSPPADPTEQVVGLLTIDEREEREPGISLPFLASADPAPGGATRWDAPQGGLDTAVVTGDFEENFPAEDADAEDSDPIEIVDELSFDDPLDDLPAVLRAGEGVSERAPDEPRSEGGVDEPMSERAPDDPFAELVASLEDVARALGAGGEAVACLDALFGQTRMEAIAAGNHAVEALVAGGVVARGTRGLVRSGPFTARVLAWQGILRGESEDFALPDGGALEPLDEWASDLLARIVGPPARADGIRRDLRRRGIAAFGLVAKAA